MKVVLNQDVKGLGYRGDIVDVKKGYFRNFLYVDGLASAATPSVIKLAESRNEKKTMKKQELLDNAKDVLKKLSGLEVTIESKASDKGKLYAAVVESDVVKAIAAAAKVELEPSYLKMDHFKEAGEYEVKVHLGKDLDETVKVNVEASK